MTFASPIPFQKSGAWYLLHHGFRQLFPADRETQEYAQTYHRYLWRYLLNKWQTEQFLFCVLKRYWGKGKAIQDRDFPLILRATELVYLTYYCKNWISFVFNCTVCRTNKSGTIGDFHHAERICLKNDFLSLKRWVGFSLSEARISFTNSGRYSPSGSLSTDALTTLARSVFISRSSIAIRLKNEIFLFFGVCTDMKSS